jgi:hypothetical protein
MLKRYFLNQKLAELSSERRFVVLIFSLGMVGASLAIGHFLVKKSAAQADAQLVVKRQLARGGIEKIKKPIESEQLAPAQPTNADTFKATELKNSAGLFLKKNWFSAMENQLFLVGKNCAINALEMSLVFDVKLPTNPWSFVVKTQLETKNIESLALIIQRLERAENLTNVRLIATRDIVRNGEKFLIGELTWNID